MCFHKPRIDKTVEIILKNLDIYSDRSIIGFITLSNRCFDKKAVETRFTSLIGIYIICFVSLIKLVFCIKLRTIN